MAAERGQRLEGRGQRSEVRSQRTEVRSQRSEVRSQRSEGRGQRSEVRGQRAEVRNQKSEDRWQRKENRAQKAERIVRQPAPAARCGRTDSWFYNRRHRSFQKILSPGVLYLDVQVEEGDPSTNSRAGIRIFGFKDGLLHTKSIVVDRQVAVFGSVNLDVRSFFKYAPFFAPFSG